jgi:hypothetical protein
MVTLSRFGPGTLIYAVAFFATALGPRSSVAELYPEFHQQSPTVDRLESGEQVRAAVGPSSMAFQAHGAWWLMSIRSQTGEAQADSHETSLRAATRPGTTSQHQYNCNRSGELTQ